MLISPVLSNAVPVDSGAVVSQAVGDMDFDGIPLFILIGKAWRRGDNAHTQFASIVGPGTVPLTAKTMRS